MSKIIMKNIVCLILIPFLIVFMIFSYLVYAIGFLFGFFCCYIQYGYCEGNDFNKKIKQNLINFVKK